MPSSIENETPSSARVVPPKVFSSPSTSTAVHRWSLIGRGADGNNGVSCAQTDPNSTAPTVEAVVFDWYATLARPLEEGWWGQVRRLIADAGGTVDESAVVAWQMMPTEHRDHSSSRETYQSWSIGRFRALLAQCGVAEHRLDAVGPGVGTHPERGDRAPPRWCPRDHRRACDAGLVVALCSNWDWDLGRHLLANGLEDAFDLVVCSAIAGYRKPNRAIFDLVLEGIGIDPAAVLFVGDDVEADLVGAIGAGITPVHAAWALPCTGGHSGDIACCSSFAELLALPLLTGRISVARSAER